MSDNNKKLLLQIDNVSKSFSGVKVLNNVSLKIFKGEVLALIGENGAGKSTLMKILSGAYKKDEGKIFLNGKEVEIENPLFSQKLGISIIYQEFNLTRNQSVAANIYMAHEQRVRGIGKYFGIVDKKKMENDAQKVLDKIKSKVSPKTKVGDLSVAQQQMVEIAKALAVESQIIIMDEPTATLGEKEVNTLFEIVNYLKKQGISIIFITHRLEEVFEITDKIVVLRDGQFVGEKLTSEADIDMLVQMMVGRNLKDFLHKEFAKITTPILEVKGLNRKGVVKDISFSLRKGEILGFAGLVGAGRTETARILFGIDRKDKGEILVDGKPVRLNSPNDAVNAGISLVPEDRGQQGLVLILSVLENIILATLKLYSKLGLMNKVKMQQTANNYIKLLSIKTSGFKQKAMYLSGGNQQKIVLAKWLASDPKILILDEPTRGIDIGAKSEIYSLMNELTKKGIAIIMISSELPEILGMSDRVVVMHEGSITGILNRSDCNQELIMAYASGQINNLCKE